MHLALAVSGRRMSSTSSPVVVRLCLGHCSCLADFMHRDHFMMNPCFIESQSLILSIVHKEEAWLNASALTIFEDGLTVLCRVQILALANTPSNNFLSSPPPPPPPPPFAPPPSHPYTHAHACLRIELLWQEPAACRGMYPWMNK